MPSPSPTAWAGVAAGLLLVAVVLLLLWLRALRLLREQRVAAREDRARAARLEVVVADQRGRLRLVRELHDVAIVRVTSLIAEAEGARYAGASDPHAAVRAAGAVAELGRSTLADLRRVMTLVRGSEAEAAPQPRLAPTRELLRTMVDAGLRVRFEETGDAYDLDSAAELAVHRILQEAMSNALQHGGAGTEVLVGLTWTPSGLAVRLDDDGFRNAVLARGLAPDDTAAELSYGVLDDLRSLTEEVDGAGIREMRARAAVFGGTLTAHRVPGVGFSVSAVFPSIRFHNGVHGVDLSRA